MWLLESILLALSLCADCFAVTTCSSITLREVSWKKVAPIALVFGFVQTAFLAAGWLFGDMFVGLVEHIAKWIGFLLLLYVGGSMLLKTLLNKAEKPLELNGFKNVILGAIATSVDALAVGISLPMSHPETRYLVSSLGSVFVITSLSVIAGMYSGQALGMRLGRIAEIVGGIVLIGIGVSMLH
ncbi:MAG: manganese efflux pump [Bacteroidales bacterium]|nr:manganese efflux pump [Bacteroidales bacterium]MDY6002032.1 manganese efflux pump [Candidatus Cryptobacteroides sp.]